MNFLDYDFQKFKALYIVIMKMDRLPNYCSFPNSFMTNGHN